MTEFRFQLHATGTHNPGRQRHVIVRCHIPVEGLFVINAGITGVRHLGKQKAGLTLICDREGKIRQIKYRHIAQIKAGVLGFTPGFAPADTDFRRADQPLFFTFRTGCETHITQNKAILSI